MSSGRTALGVYFPLSGADSLDSVRRVRFVRREFHHEICVIDALNYRTLGL